MRIATVSLCLLTWASLASASPLDRQFDGSRVKMWTESGISEADASRTEDVDVNGERHQYRVRSETHTQGKGANKKTVTHYYFEYVVTGSGSTLIGRWRAGDKGAREYKPLGVRVSKEGKAYAVVQLNFGPPKDRKSKVLWFCGPRSLRSLSQNDSWSPGILLLGQDDSPIFFWRSNLSIYVFAGEKRSELVDAAMYDWSAARLGNGQVYLFAHNYRDRSLVVRMATDEAWDWKEDYVDTEESGWQHSISATDKHVYILYYFYRNSFNKGVKIAQLGELEILTNETYHREKEFNSGWEPALAISPQNKVKLSFQKNVQEKKVQADSYANPEAMMTYARDNEHSYVDGWEDSYRDWFILAGPEAAFQFWSVMAPTPSLADAPQQFDASYDYNPSLVARGMFEARWMSTNLGISYTQGLIADTIEDNLGTNAKRLFNFVGGFIGFDKLFFGQDVRVSVGLGEFQGAYTDQDGTVATPTELYNFELSLLNQYRARFGLTYRQYSLRQPIYGYYAPEGQEEYDFVGADVVDADIKRLEVFAGYSKLDYVSKYENYFNGLDVEGKIGGGISLMNWDSVNLGSEATSMGFEPALMGQLRLVYLYFRRFYGLHGLGAYFRAGYGAELFMNGFSAGKPDAREQDEDSDGDELANSNFVTKAVHYQLQHGPFVGFGLVY
jgi:hypothetical protein